MLQKHWEDMGQASEQKYSSRFTLARHWLVNMTCDIHRGRKKGASDATLCAEIGTNTLWFLFSPVLLATISTMADDGLFKSSVSSFLLWTILPCAHCLEARSSPCSCLSSEPWLFYGGWNMKASDKVRKLTAHVCTQLIPPGYFNLCVFEEGNVTTVYCHVKSNKVCGKCKVFLEAGSFLMCCRLFLFIFLGSSFCSVKKMKEKGQNHPSFVDSLVRLSIVPAEGLSWQLRNPAPLRPVAVMGLWETGAGTCAGGTRAAPRWPCRGCGAGEGGGRCWAGRAAGQPCSPAGQVGTCTSWACIIPRLLRLQAFAGEFGLLRGGCRSAPVLRRRREERC